MGHKTHSSRCRRTSHTIWSLGYGQNPRTSPCHYHPHHRGRIEVSIGALSLLPRSCTRPFHSGKAYFHSIVSWVVIGYYSYRDPSRLSVQDRSWNYAMTTGYSLVTSTFHTKRTLDITFACFSKSLSCTVKLHWIAHGVPHSAYPIFIAILCVEQSPSIPQEHVRITSRYRIAYILLTGTCRYTVFAVWSFH